MFLGIRLDLPSAKIRPPLRSLAIQLPPGTVYDDEWVVDNLLVDTNAERCQLSIVAYGRHQGVSVAQITAFPITHEPVETLLLMARREPALLGSGSRRWLMKPELQSNCMRIVATLCLVADNPEFVRAEVLASDEEKYGRTRDGKYVAKAKRRGKYGWTVGKHVEMSPHFRNGCLALYWTGHGRTIPKIRWRKESIVHKDIVQKVPQGCMTSVTEPQVLQEVKL